MRESIKEAIIKFMVTFILIALVGYFIKTINIGLDRAFFLALGIGIAEFGIQLIKKRKLKLKY